MRGGDKYYLSVLETDAPFLNKTCRAILEEQNPNIGNDIKQELQNETDIF